MKTLIWRLGKLPTVEELLTLVKDKIITHEEARQTLFKQEDDVERDKESLKSEIKFLRDLVEKLSNNNTTKLIETIKYIEKPYYHHHWYQPYHVWCSNVGSASVTTGNNQVFTTGTGTIATGGTSSLNLNAIASNQLQASTPNFKNIATF